MTWWEWVLFTIILIFVHWLGYVRAFERFVNWLKSLKIRDRYKDIRTKLDMAYESEKELRSRLRDRLRHYFESLLPYERTVDLWYDRPILDNKITVDESMGLIICPWPHHTLNAFYTELMEMAKTTKLAVPLASKHILGYRVVNDWWVYFAGELYKTGEMIRYESDKPKVVKEPKPENLTSHIDEVSPTDAVGQSTIMGD